MLNSLIPSMFHRRLALVLAGFLLALVALGAQVAKLTLVEGDRLRAEAEARLVRTEWTPTVRGRILDRTGRVLARPKPSYSVSIAYPVLTGDWARDRAADYARRVHRAEWSKLGDDRQLALIARYEAVYRAHLGAMWTALAERAAIEPAELDRRRDGIVSRVTRMHEAVVRARLEGFIDEQRAKGSAISDAELARLRQRADQPIREQQSAHPILSNIADAQAFDFDRRARQLVELNPSGLDTREAIDPVPLMPGLEVEDASGRLYPLDRIRVEIDPSNLPSPMRNEAPRELEVSGVASHILGWMRRRVHAEDHDRRRSLIENDPAFAERVVGIAGIDRGRYREADAVGAAGIEALAEPALRGLRGLTVRRLDTGEQRVEQPEPGRDIRLTLDAMLQARVQAAMDPRLGLARVQPWHGEPTEWMPIGTPLNGAAVVLDIDTGEILAMVSTPELDRDTLATDPESIFADQLDAPWVNRVIEKPYPPGSIAKAIVLHGAAAHAGFSLGETIPCTGHLYEHAPDQFRCWIFKRYPGLTHSMTLGHDPDTVEALAVSCNIFFYTLGRRLGPAGIARTYRDFGVGEPFDLGIGEEFPGALGRDWNPANIERSDATLMGIGQGPVAWTPLHAADALATIARDGIRLPVRLLADAPRDKPMRDLRLDPALVTATLEGLDAAVNTDQGTGHHLTFENGDREPIFNPPPGVRLWGKTGTAQAPHLMIDPDAEGPLEAAIARRGDHSWFVVLAGRDRPRYAIAVLMEYAGSGGKVSGPIANLIVHALDDEGYFRGPS